MTIEIPVWLKKEIAENKSALRNIESRKTEKILINNAIRTVCEEALCPNKGKCFLRKEATFLILGDTCTRKCSFCAVKKGKPRPVDKNEPKKIASIIKKLGLKYVVITSPTRDDLPDGGALHYAEVVASIKKECQNTKTEVLIPDFAGSEKSLFTVLQAEPTVLAHNIETVPRLYDKVRQGADYKRSLELLERVKKINPLLPAKSGLMLGLGETDTEVKQTLWDLLNAGCDILTLGQYLAPSKKHNMVKKYLLPQEFAEFKQFALNIGFKAVASASLVRSSYLAGTLIKWGT